MEWISIEDKLPEDGKEVLVWGKYYFEVPTQAFIYNGVWKGSLEVTDHMEQCDRDNSRLTSGHRITHWMPLPEPPKQLTQDNQ